jgi:hypothetical protein
MMGETVAAAGALGGDVDGVDVGGVDVGGVDVSRYTNIKTLLSSLLLSTRLGVPSVISEDDSPTLYPTYS